MYHLNFSEHDQNCKFLGGGNVAWLYLDQTENNATSLQYRPHLRGKKFLKRRRFDYDPQLRHFM